MLEIKEKAMCTGCHSCYNSCPSQCISMHFDEEGFLYPQIAKEKCVNCGLCEKTCPIINESKEKENQTKAIAAVNTSDEDRLESSSGGIFTLLAREVIYHGGSVFGAAFDQNFDRVKHVCVETEEQLALLRGSKYIQSEIGSVFAQVKEKLEDGRKVFFTGTPCQVEGLYSFLRKPYDNLLTADIICHGVPSLLVWREYIREREAVVKAKHIYASFRDKTEGWESYSTLLKFDDDSTYRIRFREDPFMKAFLNNASLRPSCYKCKFKTLNRVSDLTMADFWGIDKVAPDFNDNIGTSLILVHSDRGAEMIDAIRKYMKSREVPLESVAKYNAAAVKSAECFVNRRGFMKSLKKSSFDKAVKKYCNYNFFRRVKRKLYNTIANN